MNFTVSVPFNLKFSVVFVTKLILQSVMNPMRHATCQAVTLWAATPPLLCPRCTSAPSSATPASTSTPPPARGRCLPRSTGRRGSNWPCQTWAHAVSGPPYWGLATRVAGWVGRGLTGWVGG